MTFLILNRAIFDAHLFNQLFVSIETTEGAFGFFGGLAHRKEKKFWRKDVSFEKEVYFKV